MLTMFWSSANCHSSAFSNSNFLMANVSYPIELALSLFSWYNPSCRAIPLITVADCVHCPSISRRMIPLRHGPVLLCHPPSHGSISMLDEGFYSLHLLPPPPYCWRFNIRRIQYPTNLFMLIDPSSGSYNEDKGILRVCIPLFPSPGCFAIYFGAK